ncbi:MAG: hypothetical protein K0Q73_687 [Paenibacillus sp.]|jgi:siderophore synthetase component|nr:hypothetical protein [Paenibacillus sp.]
MVQGGFMIQQQRSLEINVAEQAAVERLLNTFLRECGIFDPRIMDLPMVFNDKWKGTPFKIELKHADKTIYGELSYWSLFGHHGFGSDFYAEWLLTKLVKPISNRDVIEWILDEIASIHESSDTAQKHSQLHKEIHNSIDKTVQYADSFRDRKSNGANGYPYIQTEQSLIWGHPFHPTPKSSEGFSPDDLSVFPPEMGSAFQLHYFAVSPDSIAQQYLEEEFEEPVAESVIQQSKGKLGANQTDYALIPCHPWQAQYLLQQSRVGELLQIGKLVYVGPLGDMVYPTSSVRTVWDPEHHYFYKLPLNVRITNFIRVNTLEQIERTLAASGLIRSLQNEIENESFTILLEKGFRTVSVKHASGDMDEQLLASFAVLFRDNPPEFQDDNPPHVLASLLEVQPDETEPLLFKLIRSQYGNELPDLKQWFRAYAEITVKPILRLYSEKGVSLEAHVQNCLLRIHRGMPFTCYVRDLEGVSVSCSHAQQWGWVPTIVQPESPLLYSTDEAWSRLQYYFFVNHIGHLVSTLARYGSIEERQLWGIVADVLLTMQTNEPSYLNECIEDLLSRRTLPAKANLISRFLERGETPIYVEIPNPMSMR